MTDENVDQATSGASNHLISTPLFKVAIRFEQDVVTARQKTRRLSELLGFDQQDQARLATAVSELARNVFQYAGTGSIEFRFSIRAPQALVARVVDSGPGIEAIKDVLSGTYVSNTGLGIGMIGSKRLMDHFKVETGAGKGTVITMAKNLDSRAAAKTQSELNKIVDQLISRRAESPFEEIQNQNRDLLNALDESRRAKVQLAELNRELAETNRGVVALYAELDEKADSLLRANETKTRFLSHMTHEFRTPLSSIISLTRLLLSGLDGQLNEEQEKQVTYIRKSGESLLVLVGDLLDLAKVEAGKVSINSSEFEIDELLSSLRGVFRPMLSNNENIEFLIEPVDTGFTMQTDQGKVAQILRNLVSNAIKFTEAGKVSVATRLVGDNHENVRFTVTDTGIGIAETGHALIFEEFGQIQSAQQKQKGTGLGLPLSRKLAQLLGGTLDMESELGKGSTFYLEIPRVYSGKSEAVFVGHQPDSQNATVNNRVGHMEMSKDKNRPVAGDVESPRDSQKDKFKVLLIDHDEPSRYLVRALISEQLQAEFCEADEGRRGLEIINSWHPDLVVLDLSMPGMDGFETLDAIRSGLADGELPVIIHSARALTADERLRLESQASAILCKADVLDDGRANNSSKDALRAALHKAGFDFQMERP